MKVVVITGSTRGIGFGLARALLERGCAVVLSGRSVESVQAALERLPTPGGGAALSGSVCDVRSPASLQSLWDHCLQQFGRVDIWVNNAGLSNQPDNVWQVPTDQIKAIIDTNIFGAVIGTKVALHGMLEQGHGAIYLMEGMGSDGRMHAGQTLYGMTKYALDYFFKALADEISGTPVIVGAIRPGMVVTDLLTEPFRGRPDEWERVKPIFNIIADPLDLVSDWMAEAILANDQNGKILSRLSRADIAWRFLKAPFSRRDLFHDIDMH